MVVCRHFIVAESAGHVSPALHVSPSHLVSKLKHIKGLKATQRGNGGRRVGVMQQWAGAVYTGPSKEQRREEQCVWCVWEGVRCGLMPSDEAMLHSSREAHMQLEETANGRMFKLQWIQIEFFRPGDLRSQPTSHWHVCLHPTSTRSGGVSRCCCCALTPIRCIDQLVR
eukprot:GDKI01037822.1.p1 GENE.GDKI01037822.1~~GDKI01037822.1.p1  ORF type:complete len:169 (+),score=12.38 GDKI01037822.1:373-879(+)